MLAPLGLTLLLSAGLAPGDGLRLAPEPEPPPSAVPTSQPAPYDLPAPSGVPSIPLAAIGVAAAAAVALRPKGTLGGTTAAESPPPIVVFVPGHGTPGGQIFDDMIGRMGLDAG